MKKTEITGRKYILIYVCAFTAVLILLLVYISLERLRTHQTAAEKAHDPVLFSEESGFFEEGFILRITPESGAVRDDGTEIRYTLNGDEPTADSLLYEDGIDLARAYSDALKEAEYLEEQRQEAIAEAEAEAERLRLEMEKQAAAEAAKAEQTEEDQGAQDQPAEEQTAQNQDAQGQDTEDGNGEEEVPSLEDGRQTWQKELWTAASDDGVRPERTYDGICVIPVRACLVRGKDRSSVVTRTYVIGPGITQRYQDVYISSVVTDSLNLFDYDQGIMVKGSHYQTDVDNGVRADRAGNAYQEGDEWIKNGHVTLFSGSGEVLLEEDAGLTISGYSSRNLPTRSFRAQASREHGSSDDYFSLEIFSSASSESGNNTAAADAPDISASDEGSENGVTREVSSFRKIKFRTHGVPTYHIRCVRNQYAKQLTDECGFYGLTENRTGVMFLNGEFYTVCDITPSADTDYLCRLFGLRLPTAMEKYSGSDVDVYTKADILKLFTADLTDPSAQEALERAVDMDNYLFYFALEVLFNNADWPYNNVTIWRYRGERDSDNPYTDGRFRFVLDDMDQILSNNLHGDPTRWSTELVDYLMKDKSATFHHVMECRKYRDTFLTYVDDLLATCFAPDHACAVLDELYEGLKQEYLLDYGEEYWAEMEHTAGVTKQNVREKEELYRADIEKYMGLTERWNVRLEAGEGVRVTWNNDCGTSPDKKIQCLQPGESWNGSYYTGTSFTAGAAVAEGYRFVGWELNGVMKENPLEDMPDTGTEQDGKRRSSTSIVISDALRGDDPDAVVTLRAVAEPMPGNGK